MDPVSTPTCRSPGSACAAARTSVTVLQPCPVFHPPLFFSRRGDAGHGVDCCTYMCL